MASTRVLVTVLSFLSCVAAQSEESEPPKRGKERYGGPLGYYPTVAPAIIFCALYALVAVHGTWMMFRIRGKYMGTLVASGYIYALGLILRIPYRTNTTSLGLYLIMNLCVVLSPCGFIATVYILLGRLARYLQAEDLMLIRPQIITKVYVTSDVVTLFVQAAGGSLAAAKNETLTKLSTKIFLAGLILQLISFISYCIVFTVFLYRVKTWRAPVWHEKAENSLLSHWKGLVGIMMVSCLGIIVRCVYRTVEGSEGFSGYLLTHEVYFYVLDCLPLFIAIAVYTIIWPPAILNNLYTSPGHEMVAKDSVGSP
ncbi:hypothetical protein FRC12_009879 [Ceratobasidium sp. 428]|nr:hypothetical protein FRC12_009879 [Ceratobasidium sp. 428]